jgi:hypothetical protein
MISCADAGTERAAVEQATAQAATNALSIWFLHRL